LIPTAIIPNAKVVGETGTFRREVVSGETGRYETELPMGNYLVTVVRDDFHPTIIKDHGKRLSHQA